MMSSYEIIKAYRKSEKEGTLSNPIPDDEIRLIDY